VQLYQVRVLNRKHDIDSLVTGFWDRSSQPNDAQNDVVGICSTDANADAASCAKADAVDTVDVGISSCIWGRHKCLGDMVHGRHICRGDILLWDRHKCLGDMLHGRHNHLHHIEW
jgi:hypothetical protein